MFRIHPRHLALIPLIALCGIVRGQPASQPADQLTPRWRTVARWYGRFDHNVEQYATREPGLFGMALSGAHYRQVARGNVVLREEVDDVLGLSRTVPESFSWDSAVSDLYYVNKDGSRVPAGDGGGGGASFG